MFARLDEETEACDAAGIDWHVVPGITAASAAAAAIGQSLTRRNRNSGLRVLTGHDVDGFADHTCGRILVNVPSALLRYRVGWVR